MVDALRTSPGTLTAGETFTLSTRVRNVGNGTAAAATTLRYYRYDSDSRDWRVVGSSHVCRLSAAASRAEAVRLTAPSRAGAHFDNACVASVAGERIEDNCFGNLRVTVTGRRRGTRPRCGSDARTSPGTLTAGETFTLSTRVRNVGSGAVAVTTLHYYYRSSDSEWVVVGQDHMGALPASTSRSESIRLRAPSRAHTTITRASPVRGTRTTAPATCG